MRETAAYKYRIFALFLIVAALLHETHLGLSEITNIGRCYQQVQQCISDDFASLEASAQSTADTIACVENTIVRDTCIRELLDSSHNRVLNGIYRSMAGRKRETGAAFRHFPWLHLFWIRLQRGDCVFSAGSFSPVPQGSCCLFLIISTKLTAKNNI